MSSHTFRDDCLKNRVVLITGGAGAVGTVIVNKLLNCGARVAVNDVLNEDEESVSDLLGLGGAVKYFKADITIEEEVFGLFDHVTEAFGVPNVVCCHAGVVESGPYREYSLQAFEKLMDVNLKAAFIVSREAVRRLDGQCASDNLGRIIFTSSWVQDVPWPGIVGYTASKGALKQLMRTLAREMGGKHIVVNAIAPGIVGVGMAKHQWDNEPEYRRRAGKAIPMGELQCPESVADAFVFLASDASSYMTGATLLVDGGCSLYPMD